ncbi:copper amine oxidase N-terminal domain-containing protein [Acetoanaerobium noterae]|uniref:copper amine oxidase N-terminal domain-containing protein n=1 Tax=Acetoanaerobium noterae TaxID=745369 RepID=UPI0028AC1BF6|nr:copper amine oxidase N-terminal domain-containing protein [Acetoanaerobium noterae]
MKRKLSLLMVLMMMLTLIPANMAFAASSAVVNTSVTSADGVVDFEIEIEAKGTGIATGDVFRLTLNGDADFVDENDSFADAFDVEGPATINDDNSSSTALEVEVDGFVASGDSISISGKVELDGAEGDQTVTIANVIGSSITRQTLTFAVVSGSGDFIVNTLESNKTVYRKANQNATDFEIREATSAAMKPGTVEFQLPKGVTWVYDGASIDKDVTTTIGTSTDLDLGTVSLSSDKRTLSVEITDVTPNTDRLIIRPRINVDRDAKLGDIEISVDGNTTDIDVDDIKIATYKEYGVVLEVDEAKTIVAGKAEENKAYTVDVTINQAGNSLIAGRYMEFTVDGGTVKVKDNDGTTIDMVDADDNGYSDEFDLTVPQSIGTNDIELQFYVKGDWDSVGELKLTGKGAGMEEQTVKLADILTPAKITTKVDDKKTVADVIVGLQNQATPEIKITESQAGSLAEGYYVFDLNQARYNGVEFLDSNVKFETTGNISVDDVYTIENGEKLIVYVDGESSKEASTITIKGLQVTLDRTVPFGQLDLRFGAAVADDDAEFGINPEKEKYEVETIIEKVPFLNVVTEVQTARQQKTVFTLDSVTYTVGSETKTLDAAPYISNNRTMLPIGTVAQLAGATLNYSPSTRTAVFTKDNLVVSMNLDTNILLVNGSPVPMDAKPEIVNSRAFVPVVYVAQAFGIQNGIDIVYDAASRTVTLFPNAQ